MLKSDDSKTIGNVGYWIGDLLGDLVNDLDQGEKARNVTGYFLHLADIVAEAKLSGLLTSTNWRTLTNRQIYRHHVTMFSPAKVERESLNGAV